MSNIGDLRIHKGRCQMLVHIEEREFSIKRVWKDAIKIYLETHFLKTDKPIEYEPIINFIDEEFPEDAKEVYAK